MPDEHIREEPKAWRPKPGGMPKPSLRDAMQPGYVAQTPDQATADELDRWSYWRKATLEERGATLAGLLRLVSAMRRFPPKQSMFPGWRRLIEQRTSIRR
jgi:hypothetical protein